RASSARRPAAGRSQAALTRRDRRAQRGLQAVLAGDLARVGVLGHPRRLRAPALEKRLTLQTVDQAFCLLSAETREFPVASERSLILRRITRPTRHRATLTP